MAADIQSKETKLTKLSEMFSALVSLPSVEPNIPKINFKKIKLTKLTEFDSILKTKNITKVFLDDNLLRLNLPIKRVTVRETYESKSVNPLRKKFEQEEKIQPVDLNEDITSYSDVEDKIDKQVSQEDQPEAKTEPLKEKEKTNVTFNVEAQIAHDEENVIFSPGTVSLPPLKKDVVSSSGDQIVSAWPPQPKSVKEKKIKKQKVTKKPYFISSELLQEKPESKEKQIEKTESKDLQESLKEQVIEKRVEPVVSFPWLTSEQEYSQHESVAYGGLESELLDVSLDKQKDQELTTLDKAVSETTEQGILQEQKVEGHEIPKIASSQPVQLKALVAEQPSDLFTGIPAELNLEALNTGSVFDNFGKKFSNDVKFQGKVKNMFDKFRNAKLTPIGIVILGGVAVTLGYLSWSHILPSLRFFAGEKSFNDKVIVRDLFKEKYTYKPNHLFSKNVGVSKTTTTPKQEKEEMVEKDLKPITEQERQSLIQKAREALEARLDPFGQDEILTPVVEEKAKEKEEEQKPQDISKERKQVELVGVISADNKNLALVNIYVIDYTVLPDDDKATMETKLKTALSMTVPNRIEVSLLDNVEDWYVKQIIKSKSRSEDPYIELVKEDKKFKLKVGQKLLLPEESPEETPKETAKEAPEGAPEGISDNLVN